MNHNPNTTHHDTLSHHGLIETSWQSKNHEYEIGLIKESDKLKQLIHDGALDTIFGDISRMFVECYSDPPWNEGFKCQNCGEKIGKCPLDSSCDSCPKCNSENIKPFHDLQEVQDEMKWEFQQEIYAAVLFFRGEIAGISIGYIALLDDIWDKKLNNVMSQFISMDEFIVAIKAIQVESSSLDSYIYYFADLWVVHRHRYQEGLAYKLFQESLRIGSRLQSTRDKVFAVWYSLYKSSMYDLALFKGSTPIFKENNNYGNILLCDDLHRMANVS